MITLTWTEFNDQAFATALMGLYKTPQMEQKTAYRIGRLVQIGMREMEKFKKAGTEIESKYQTHKEGELQPCYSSPEDEEKCKQELAELGKTVINIPLHKLDFYELKGLSPRDYMALECVIEKMPEDTEITT